ncbi:MAG: hypothetical protein AB7N71_05425 [Phycisphaerae bacterium]
MNKWRTKSRMMLLMISSAALLPQVGNCLSDRQLTSILETVITTGLTTLVNSAITAATQTG